MAQVRKWFMALNQDSRNFVGYADMVKVAVQSALRHDELEPHLLYDGEDNDLTDWLRRKGVTVIRRRSFLYEHLSRAAEKRDDPGVRTIGAGAFLRVELPALAAERGWPDSQVLYTDCDVMFLGRVSDHLARLPCRSFAVAPEFERADYRAMNTGVMVMNLPRLRRRDAEFRRFIVEHLDEMLGTAWDQTAYIKFYRGPRPAGLRGWLSNDTWDRLPVEFNWKPYWGRTPHARIVHFHGPKPRHARMPAESLPEQIRILMTDSYRDFCHQWEAALADAA
jgi:hypothetical protein